MVIAATLPWPAWLDGNGGRPEEHCHRLFLDTSGPLLVVMVTSASVRDREGARPAPAHPRDLVESVVLV
ncbi:MULTISPECIES: hypothetical protein [unclassified Streptomyces]|uniref:hypothetical protein n=1 Tax=unclassified Streptomyces TaxID=2593676 RepID=UPI0019070CD7|nr:hypothetical protein [Streptomyces sp. HSG2]